MKKKRISSVLIKALAVFCLCFVPSSYYQISLAEVMQESSNFSTRQLEILAKLEAADVVYLGETHDRLADHQAQLQIIERLHEKRKGKIVLAMEMFQRPYQKVLDRYIKREISEAQMLEQSEYEDRWGFGWENYQAIAKFARTHRVPIIAMNTPTEVSRKVARQGLDKLTPEETKHIPPEGEIDLSNAEYRAKIQKVYDQHVAHAHGNSSSFDRFFLTQVLWDETMAESIAEFVKSQPKTQVIVLVGQAHVAYGYGIPSRVERRLGQDSVRQLTVVFDKERSVDSKKVADFVWQNDN
jgi:uncharacterized iron-regulated protein